MNGGFTKFTTWGKCTKKCGGGLQTRTRTCTKPTPAYGGKNCNGKLKETRPCNTMHCPGKMSFYSQLDTPSVQWTDEVLMFRIAENCLKFQNEIWYFVQIYWYLAIMTIFRNVK